MLVGANGKKGFILEIITFTNQTAGVQSPRAENPQRIDRHHQMGQSTILVRYAYRSRLHSRPRRQEVGVASTSPQDRANELGCLKPHPLHTPAASMGHPTDTGARPVRWLAFHKLSPRQVSAVPSPLRLAMWVTSLLPHNTDRNRKGKVKRFLCAANQKLGDNEEKSRGRWGGAYSSPEVDVCLRTWSPLIAHKLFGVLLWGEPDRGERDPRTDDTNLENAYEPFVWCLACRFAMCIRKASPYRKNFRIQNFCCLQVAFTSSKRERLSQAFIGSTHWPASTNTR